jgi:DNA-binding protein H-NS
MARPRNLASLSIDALLELRDRVTDALSDQAAALKRQLSMFASDEGSQPAAKARRRKSKLAGRKVAPKYRDKVGNTWSGRGAQPRWMTAAIKGGAKRESFLIARTAKTAKRKAKQ